MLAADPEAFLCIGDAAHVRCLGAKEVVLELVHARIGEHERGVILVDDGGGGHDFMLFGSEKIEVGLADLCCCHLPMINGLFWPKVI